MRSHKTRSTRDRSIPRSLQRWVSTKCSISRLTFLHFIIYILYILYVRIFLEVQSGSYGEQRAEPRGIAAFPVQQRNKVTVQRSVRYGISTGIYVPQSTNDSTRRFAARAALTSKITVEQDSNDEADRKVNDFRCKLTSSNCQERHLCSRITTRTPHVCAKCIEKGWRERAVLYISYWNRNYCKGKSFAHHASAVYNCVPSIRIPGVF